MKTVSSKVVLVAVICLLALAVAGRAQTQYPREELAVSDNPVGSPGGRLVVSLRSEPKTLNPVTSTDNSSREVIAQMVGKPRYPGGSERSGS